MKNSIFTLIRKWAKQRGIYSKGDSKTQLVKLIEETGELAQAILKRDDVEFYDAIGDCAVVLTNLVECYENERINLIDAPDYKMKIEDCINNAYQVIIKRTGKMVDGTFVKD